MLPELIFASQKQPDISLISVAASLEEAKEIGLPNTTSEEIEELLKPTSPLITGGAKVFSALAVKGEKGDHRDAESLRKAGSALCQRVNANKVTEIQVVGTDKEAVLPLVEGILLSNYNFEKYLSEKGAKTLVKIHVNCKSLSEAELSELQNLAQGVFHTRDFVNEPQGYLTATQFSEDMTKWASEAGYKIEVFNKQKIESLKMGGLLAVNKGSVEPPTFNILEHKPQKAINDKPYVLVGKGVVYDTGGLSLKPTANSMDFMKSDMGGAAAVFGTLYSVAKNNLPIWVVGLIPATDNRPSGAAYAPGDVITMYNGKTVEVLNTDAEGRMILADALTYAQKYNPELVIDLATLTGAASRTVGTQAIVSMGTAPETTHAELKKCGFDVYERLAELPFWEEYGEMMKSDIADLKNIGGATAGSITAGKFLEHFTMNKEGEHAYPWIHLDIAGPAFLSADEGYRLKNGTGVGVRLLYHFLKQKAKNA